MAYFPEVKAIAYEGPDSKNPLAFRHYNATEKVLGKTMAEHLRFAVSYWHTFTYQGSDPFGLPNMIRPWNELTGMDLAKARVEAIFEFLDKVNAPYFCFHDRDIAPEADTLRETNRNLDEIVSMLKAHMKQSGKKLLWNTSNLFSHPRFAQGGATTPNADVYAFAAAQVKKSLEIGKELDAQNYVFWGGREGYDTLLNTDLKREQDNLARFMHMACDYADEINKIRAIKLKKANGL